MQISRLGFLFAGLAAVVFAGALRAADLRGTVRSAQTGAYLEAVEVTVVGKPLTVRTDREGRFALPALAPGQYQLRIVYPGSREETMAVTVTGAPSALVEVSLRPADDDREVVQLGRFVVAGEREGYAASVARQKAADHIQNVLSMDTYGTIADGNIGNFLQRVAGVTANKDAGDVVGVMVRGMPPELNAVQMDGVRLAAADSGINQGDRSVRIDQLPSEFIKEIEIIKANLPEQWADALGGTVNLVTKSAFDYKTDVRTYQAGASVNTFRDNLWEWRPFGTFTYLNAFGPERNAGVALSGSYNESTHPRDWVQVQRLELDDRVTQARLLDDVVRRKRSGLSSKLELRRPERLQLKFDAALNLYHQTSDRNAYNVGDSGGRRVADYSRRSRAQIESGLAPAGRQRAVRRGGAGLHRDVYGVGQRRVHESSGAGKR
jgi:outer membrane receptor protein involved in Fe transport